MSYAPGAPESKCSRHMTREDHSRVVDRSMVTGAKGPRPATGEARLWTCSDCGREGVWSRRWAYWGNLECLSCSRVVIDHVSCGCKAQKGRPSR